MFFGQTTSLVENGVECTLRDLASIDREGELKVRAISAGCDELRLDVISPAWSQRIS